LINLSLIFPPRRILSHPTRGPGLRRGAGDLNSKYETAVIRHFQERMPRRLFVPEVP
jgi:hypothetical protein